MRSAFEAYQIALQPPLEAAQITLGGDGALAWRQDLLQSHRYGSHDRASYQARCLLDRVSLRPPKFFPNHSHSRLPISIGLAECDEGLEPIHPLPSRYPPTTMHSPIP